jgi:LmbE family N-acetylglucosaminyl deacetylase
MSIFTNDRIFIPDNGDVTQAIKKTTHLAIAAHQDDVEIMAQHGILECFGQKDAHFSAVVITDGAGSPRTGIYEAYNDEEMKNVRLREQKKAAIIGEYAALFLLKYPSAVLKDAKERRVIDDLKEILLETRPKIVYTHNPADKHETHVAASLRTLAALREISTEYVPERVLGCEVWRNLDWVNDDEKIVLDISDRPALKAALLGVFDSQIEGGKRYDLASLGRYCANATFYESHDTDRMTAACYAIDLTPLVKEGDVTAYIKSYIDRFSRNVEKMINKLEGKTPSAY